MSIGYFTDQRLFLSGAVADLGAERTGELPRGVVGERSRTLRRKGALPRALV
jgi:hypothetical protein